MRKSSGLEIDQHALESIYGGMKWQDFRQSDNVIDLRNAPPMENYPPGGDQAIARDYADWLNRGDYSQPYSPTSEGARDALNRIDQYQRDNNQSQTAPQPSSTSPDGSYTPMGDYTGIGPASPQPDFSVPYYQGQDQGQSGGYEQGSGAMEYAPEDNGGYTTGGDF
jgi:hypothetical protein